MYNVFSFSFLLYVHVHVRVHRASSMVRGARGKNSEGAPHIGIFSRQNLMKTNFILIELLQLGGPTTNEGPRAKIPPNVHVHCTYACCLSLFLYLIILFFLFLADPFYQTLYLLFWGLLIIACSVFLYKNGPDFVDSPKLVQTDGKKTV